MSRYISMAAKRRELISHLIDYILETEGEDYFNWCDENNFDYDSKQAMNAHVYGYACQILKKKPSYFLGGSHDQSLLSLVWDRDRQRN